MRKNYARSQYRKTIRQFARETDRWVEIAIAAFGTQRGTPFVQLKISAFVKGQPIYFHCPINRHSAFRKIARRLHMMGAEVQFGFSRSAFPFTGGDKPKLTTRGKIIRSIKRF